MNHMYERGDDPEGLEEMRESIALQREANERYEKFIADRSRQNIKGLIIDAYEDILTHERAEEKKVLNFKRNEEYEKNRPPKERWYEMKTSGFQRELYRNRVALTPNNLNAVYLENLQDQNLY